MTVYIALIHHPVYNRNHEVVTTCITPFDVHDIARTAMTYGIKQYYIVNPLPAQQDFIRRIRYFWEEGAGAAANPTRHEPIKIVSIKSNLEEVKEDIKSREGQPLKIVGTSARMEGNISFEGLKKTLRTATIPYLLLFGTGWGMTEELLDSADLLLEPIQTNTGYNHLSVRNAAAIIMDRLLGGIKS
jgi:hypothetical protein